MLRPSYESLEAIPENQRGAYVQKDNRYVLDDLDAAHPVLITNRDLKAEKQQIQSEVESLRADLASAKANSLPRGHVAVVKAEAEALDRIKAKGTVEQAVAQLDEYPALKSEIEGGKREKHLHSVAETLAYEPEAFTRLHGLPEFELRDVTDAAGKVTKQAIAKIKDANGVITERPAKEFIEGHADYKPFLVALAPQKQGTPANFGPSGGQGPKNIVDDFIKERDAAAASRPSPFNRAAVTTA